jgi:signal transduction histidine kinase
MHKTLLAEPTSPALKGNQRRQGWWLVAARTIYVLLTGPPVFLFFFSLPTYYAQSQIICPTLPSCSSTGQLSRGMLPWFQSAHISVAAYAASLPVLATINALVSLIIGLLIVWRLWGKPNEWLGLLTSFVLILLGTIENGNLSSADLSPATPVLLTIGGLTSVALSWPATGMLLLTFPTGRFAPRWTWLLLFLWVVQEVIWNPQWPPLLFAAERLLVWGSSFAVLFYRYRYFYTYVQRQQTKWLLYGFVLFELIYILYGALQSIPSLNTPNSLYLVVGPPLLYLIHLTVPLAVGIALLRYRLWDIDVLINRTLVYGTLTVSVIGLYVLVVVGLGSLIQAQGNLLLSLLATGLIAVLFQPARARLQQGVNRLLYGERDEPARVLTRLGQRLEATLTPDAVLPAIVETVAQALKLPEVEITWIPAEGGSWPHIGASYGQVKEQTTQTRVPLVYQHETVGELVLAPRQPGESLTPADQRFLRQLAPQIGVAVHAVRLTADLKQLTADLQRSRTQLVTAREEERRRLRRDLHDGLGSVLASLNWRAGALRALLGRDPVAADALVVEQQHTIQAAIGDIRRLVYDLRPPALDELGLIGAIREQAEKQNTAAERDRSAGLQVEVCVPDALPALPAAVEVAAYRIAQEALTNVAHHAHAHRCTLCLSCTEDHLEVVITDDGTGLPAEHHVGVGLLSMRERAEELGGRCEVKNLEDAGTQVRASLPLLKDEEQR